MSWYRGSPQPKRMNCVVGHAAKVSGAQDAVILIAGVVFQGLEVLAPELHAAFWGVEKSRKFCGGCAGRVWASR